MLIESITSVVHPGYLVAPGCANMSPFDAAIYIQERTHNVSKSAPQTVLSGMQLTVHATRRTPHGSSGFVQVAIAWSVKSLRAPPRNCRDARVYGANTRDMHDVSTLPPRSPTTRPSPASLSMSSAEFSDTGVTTKEGVLRL